MGWWDMIKPLKSLNICGPDWPDNAAWLRKPLETDVLGLDTEFTGLDYWSEDWKLRLVQFYDGTNVYLYDVQNPVQEQACCEVLEGCPQFISHDAADCLSVYRHFGIDITGRNWDTKVMAQLLWPGETVSHGLKDLVTEHIGPQLIQLEEDLHTRFLYLAEREGGRLTKADIGKGFATISTEDTAYRMYAAGDAYYVKHLFGVMEPMMYEKGVDKAWENECKIRAIATRMTMRGMATDSGSLEHLLLDWSSRHSKAQETFMTNYGVLAKSPFRADVLIRSGVKLTKKTAKGNWCLGKEIVKELAAEYPDNEPLKLLVEVAETSNVATFLTTLKGFVDTAGLVHPSISTLGAETGRWSVTKPAVQTVSGHNPCRSVFVPRAGNVLLSADLGQIEPRVAVGLAGEWNLIPLLLSGMDVYDAGSIATFGDSYTKEQRKRIKRGVLGSLYAAGEKTLLEQAKLMDGWHDATIEDIKLVRNQWKQAAPQIEEYSKYLQLLPRIDLESGRYVPRDERRPYKAINSVCQGTARDVLMERLIKISERYDEYLVMTLHDEILMDVPITEVRAVFSFVRSVMESGYNGIPTPTDIEIFSGYWSGAGVPIDEYLKG